MATLPRAPFEDSLAVITLHEYVQIKPVASTFADAASKWGNHPLTWWKLAESLGPNESAIPRIFVTDCSGVSDTGE